MPSATPTNPKEETHPYQILEGYLTDPSPPGPNSHHINDFASHLEQQSATTATDLEPRLWTCWQALTTHASQAPHQEAQKLQRLVDFLLALQQRQDFVLANSEVAKIWGDRVVWRDLPVFGAQIRECWNFSDASQEEQVNLNAFLAVLVHTVHTTTPTNAVPSCLDFSLHGLWTLRTALETPASEPPTPTALQAACLWFLHAARSLHKLCSEGKDFDGKLARAGDGVRERFPAWKGFSVERWGVWKAALGGLVGERGSGDEEMGDLVVRATEAMEGVEG